MPYYEELDHLPAEELLAWGIRTFGDTFAISTSFQKSGMVIIDMAARISGKVRVVTLDTGRLPGEARRSWVGWRPLILRPSRSKSHPFPVPKPCHPPSRTLANEWR